MIHVVEPLTNENGPNITEDTECTVSVRKACARRMSTRIELGPIESLPAILSAARLPALGNSVLYTGSRRPMAEIDRLFEAVTAVQCAGATGGSFRSKNKFPGGA